MLGFQGSAVKLRRGFAPPDSAHPTQVPSESSQTGMYSFMEGWVVEVGNSRNMFMYLVLSALLLFTTFFFSFMRFFSNIGRLATQDELTQRKEEALDDYASQVNLLFELAIYCSRVL